MFQSSIFMSFTVNLQSLAFISLHFPLNNPIVNFTFRRFLCRSAVDAEFFYTPLLEKSTRKIHLCQIQNQLYVNGLQNNGFIITKFISRCCDLKEIDYARQVFDLFPEPYVFLWNAILRGYSMHSMFDKVVEMYSRMQREFVSPDAFTFPYVLKACGALPAVGYGRAVHAQILRYGCQKDEFLQNGLLSFYIKCEENAVARVVFDRLKNKDVVSWTSIISGYVQNRQSMEALRIFGEMRGSNVKPDWIALVSVLKAYSEVEDLNQGRCVHGLVIRMGYELEPDLCIALTSLYAKSGEVMAAKSLFDQVKFMNVVKLWNSMISGFAKSGYPAEAYNLFTEMIASNIQPDAVTIQSSVLACAQLGSLEQAKKMDDYADHSPFRDNVVIRTALIDMYSKCGSVELSRRVFNQTGKKDVIVWSAMIMGYGLHGWGREAINLFNDMKKSGVSPNEVTFLGLITACSHSGLVKEGWELFHAMKDHKLEPHQKHYASVVDMLGRAGHLNKAYTFITSMPVSPGISVWGALLSACKMHRHVTLGEYAAEKLFTLDKFNTGQYVQLSNLYASVRLWEGVAKVRKLMKTRGMVKDSGYSMIEINGKMDAFRMGDESHPRSNEIYTKLEWLETRLMESGFTPDSESSLHDLDAEDQNMALCNHSERLAIAYGLIATSPRATLRITKNLRACVNCHLATKVISKLVGREIVVRDANRFHHFRDGTCSCGDYW